MHLSSVFSDEAFRWVILPLFIFFARILDVSLGTMRIVFVSKGLKYLAPIVGFFEVFIWIVAIKELMQNLTNVLGYVAYAGGFATGNFIGLILEKKLAVGMAMIRVVTVMDASSLIEKLKTCDCGVTSLEAQGSRGKVHVIYMVVRRADLQRIIAVINEFNPKAFVTVEDVRQVNAGVFPVKNNSLGFPKISLFRYFRKGK